jgi:hypothetical protein
MRGSGLGSKAIHNADLDSDQETLACKKNKNHQMLSSTVAQRLMKTRACSSFTKTKKNIMVSL